MIPKKFDVAIQKVKELEWHNEYSAAFIFGSVAREDISEDSDLDIKVITALDNECKNINHPFINGIKLDITFLSQGQLEKEVNKEQIDGRIPMIVESIIIFDKKKKLKELKNRYAEAVCPTYSSKDYQNQQFFIYHIDEKV